MENFICEFCGITLEKEFNLLRHQKTTFCKRIQKVVNVQYKKFIEEKAKLKQEIDNYSKIINDYEITINKLTYKEQEYIKDIKYLTLMLEIYKERELREYELQISSIKHNVVINNNFPPRFRFITSEEIIVDKEEIMTYLYREDGFIDIFYTIEQLIKKYYTTTPTNIILDDINRNKVRIFEDNKWEYKPFIALTRNIIAPFISIIKECYEDLLDELNEEKRKCTDLKILEKIEYNITVIKKYSNSNDHFLFGNGYKKEIMNLIKRSIRNLNK